MADACLHSAACYIVKMSARPIPAPVSVEDYLAGELASEIKHEYLGGAMHAMSGGSIRHTRIASNAHGSLFGSLRGKTCEAFQSDAKVRIQLLNQTRFYYPDAQVVCDSNPGNAQFQERPVVIVKVLSPSTRRIDLGEKRDAYLTLPSLKVLLLVEADAPHVWAHRRLEDGTFANEVYSGLEAIIPLPEVDASLPLADLYDRVTFED